MLYVCSTDQAITLTFSQLGGSGMGVMLGMCGWVSQVCFRRQLHRLRRPIMRRLTFRKSCTAHHNVSAGLQ